MGTAEHPSPDRFLFATGIECSYPTVQGHGGQTVRVDLMERTFHYRHWEQDLGLVRELGLSYLRYGPPYYRVHQAPDAYDWEWCDPVFAKMRGDVVGAGRDRDFGGAQRIGMTPSPRIAQRGDVIDVDAETNGARLAHRVAPDALTG